VVNQVIGNRVAISSRRNWWFCSSSPKRSTSNAGEHLVNQIPDARLVGHKAPGQRLLQIALYNGNEH